MTCIATPASAAVRRSLRRLSSLLLLSTSVFAAAGGLEAQNAVDRYDVKWTTPSSDSSGSMPIGNGDVGANVWVDPNGDLCFYVGKTDAWSETVRLLKLGRVRVHFSPAVISKNQPFEQTLRLSHGDIVITSGPPDKQSRITIYVDANNPVIRVDAETAEPVEMQVFYERWRDQQRLLEGQEANSAYGLEGGPEPLISYGDSLQLDAENRVVWYHRNTHSAGPAIMKLQGLTASKDDFGDPILDRTFGAAIQGDGLVNMNTAALHSKEPVRKHSFAVYALTSMSGSSEDWISNLNKLIAKVNSTRADARRTQHDQWWNEFWDRSWIRVTGGTEQDKVTQGYTLQRFINACGGRGVHPIKSNGSIFTFDAREKDETLFDADYRRLGGAFQFQTTRLVYWPMLASGDFDLMQPFFRMYVDRKVMADRRTKLFFDHDGTFFPENMYFWGAYLPSEYGWKREGKPLSAVESPVIRNYFSNSIELLAMMFEYYDYTQDKQFLRTQLTSMADGVITFYDKHYERDANGKIRFTPAQALETYPDVVNPLPEIAGLKYVINQVLDEKVPIAKSTQLAARRILSQLPDMPTGQTNGKSTLLAAERAFSEAKGTENPELYAVFPYRLYGVGKPNIEIAVDTFMARHNKGTGGWSQDAIQAAFLGQTDTAKEYVVKNYTAENAGRFPGFWGPNTDWSPDQAHGNVAAMALEAMLLQGNGNQLLLFPAWPKDWNVEFKLHAPNNTTVEGVYKDGKVVQLNASPGRRSGDITQMAPR